MRRRRFNIGRAKRVVMGLSALVLGAWSALTGIAAQAAGGPYIVFMLGYTPVKAGATASLFAMAAAVGGVAGWLLARGDRLPLGIAVCAAAGAVLGVLIGTPIARRASSLRRLGQALLIILMLFVVAEGTRTRFAGLPHLDWAILSQWYGWVLTGTACGLAAHVLALPTGVFLVPALVFGVALPPALAIVVALSAAAVAALAPTIGLLAHRAMDPHVGPAMCVGGAVGGLLGGAFLAARTSDESSWPLAVFGATAMTLTAWLAYREQ